MIIEMNKTIGSIDIETTLTSSIGNQMIVGQEALITYRGISPKIAETAGEKSAIIFRMNETEIDVARTCSRSRGAYFDNSYLFAPTEPGTYVFHMKGGLWGETWNEFADIADLTIIVEG